MGEGRGRGLWIGSQQQQLQLLVLLVHLLVLVHLQQVEAVVQMVPNVHPVRQGLLPSRRASRSLSTTTTITTHLLLRHHLLLPVLLRLAVLHCLRHLQRMHRRRICHLLASPPTLLAM